jgi:hypothetical protein
MEVTIEAEIAEQKDTLSKEFSTFSEILVSLGIEGKVKQVIIPKDIAETVREIEGDLSYEAEREHQHVIAKVLHSDDGAIMLFSPVLFSPIIVQLRWLTYLHEIIHIYTKTVFTPIETESPSIRWYLTNLYILYDEYYANRKSLEMADRMFEEKTGPYNRHLRGFIGHLRALRKQDSFYNPLKKEIVDYSQHGDIRLFLSRIDSTWDQATKTIVYSYAFIDYKERNKRLEKYLRGAAFINAYTEALIELFRLKYRDNNFDLHEGLDAMKDFTLNFGMAWQDMENGFYNCYVHHI